MTCHPVDNGREALQEWSLLGGRAKVEPPEGNKSAAIGLGHSRLHVNLREYFYWRHSTLDPRGEVARSPSAWRRAIGWLTLPLAIVV
jgi:hypothetical protein